MILVLICSSEARPEIQDRTCTRSFFFHFFFTFFFLQTIGGHLTYTLKARKVLNPALDTRWSFESVQRDAFQFNTTGNTFTVVYRGAQHFEYAYFFGNYRKIRHRVIFSKIIRIPPLGVWIVYKWHVYRSQARRPFRKRYE